MTAMAVALGMAILHEGVCRVAELRFGHPYAVVAVASQRDPRTRQPGPWDGVPVFSAWVAHPDSAS